MNVIGGIRDSIVTARSWARRLSLAYIGVIAIWIVVQAGIPMAPYLNHPAYAMRPRFLP